AGGGLPERRGRGSRQVGGWRGRGGGCVGWRRARRVGVGVRGVRRRSGPTGRLHEGRSQRQERRPGGGCGRLPGRRSQTGRAVQEVRAAPEDRKSTRLNSSHVKISYAVFCLKKKKKKN